MTDVAESHKWPLQPGHREETPGTKVSMSASAVVVLMTRKKIPLMKKHSRSHHGQVLQDIRSSSLWRGCST